MTISERYRIALDRFEQEMPVAETELHYGSPYELLVAVILSAQCTDKRVNIVTPPFFEVFPTPQSLAKADPDRAFELIKSVTFPNNKTKSLIGMARRLVEEYGGEVPSDIDALTTLPGVGRKTANVILAVVFGKAAMAVDTHVFRVSERIGLTTGSRNPLQTEKALVEHIPEAIIPKAHHWLILHGRYVCKARKPMCESCFLTDICRYYATESANADAMPERKVAGNRKKR